MDPDSTKNPIGRIPGQWTDFGKVVREKVKCKSFWNVHKKFRRRRHFPAEASSS
jgi:hypothetical protein